MTRLDAALRRLVERGVLSDAQADAVRSEVAAGDHPAAGRAGSISPAAEVAGYLGGVLTLVAVMFLVGSGLEDAPGTTQAMPQVALVAVLLWAGAAVRGPGDAARARLSSTLWTLAVLLTGVAAATAIHEGRDAETVFAAGGGAAFALAVVL